MKQNAENYQTQPTYDAEAGNIGGRRVLLHHFNLLLGSFQSRNLSGFWKGLRALRAPKPDSI